MTAVLSEAAGSLRGLRVENRNPIEKVAGRARLVPLIYPAPNRVSCPGSMGHSELMGMAAVATAQAGVGTSLDH